MGSDTPAGDWVGASPLLDPLEAAESLDEAGGASVPAGGAVPWAGGVKGAVALFAGLGWLAVLAFSLKAWKVFSPAWGALIAKTIPLLQWL